MNIKLQTNEQLSATVANGLAGVFVNGVSLSASLSAKADLTALQNCYTKSETSSANEISNAFELSSGNKVFIDDRISGIVEQTDLSIVHLSSTDYAQLCADGQLLSNALYIVEDSFTNNYGKQIKNVAEPVDNTDAANKQYVDDAISNIQIPTDLSAFTNSPGYLVSNDISDYYKKSETSSSSEISNELKKYQLSGNYLSTNALENYYAKSETSSANEISIAFENAGGKVYFDNRISGVTGSNDLSVVKLSADEYAQMLDDGTCLSNAIYIVEAPNIDAFRQQIKNVAEPTLSDDAATKGYVDTNFLSAVPTNYKTYMQTTSALSNDGYATTSQVNAKSTVGFSQMITTGTNIASITIDGTTTQIYAPNGGSGGSSVQVSADYSTGTRVATISVDSVPTTIYVPNSATGSAKYALTTAQLQDAGSALSCSVNDQTITTIQISSASTPVIIQLPAASQDGARDFLLRVEISSSTAPTFTFQGIDETIEFDSDDDSWAILEPGLNLISFTETKQGQ